MSQSEKKGKIDGKTGEERKNWLVVSQLKFSHKNSRQKKRKTVKYKTINQTI